MGERDRPAWVLSPCGTSVLTNQPGDEDGLRKLLGTHANAADPSNIPDEDADRIRDHIEKCGRSLADASPTEAIRLSAELNGICRFYGGQPRPRPSGRPDEHVLLTTDTWLGRECGRLIGDWLEGQGMSVRIENANDLKTDDLLGFREGLSHVAEWLGEEAPRWRSSGYEIVFNLTGGFKSVQGFLQTLATFHADRSIYVFRTGELMEIPRLPVRLETRETVEKNLEQFRPMARGEELPAAKCRAIAETLLTEMDGEVHLSEWGKAIWTPARDEIYAERLLEPHHQQIAFTGKFRKSAADLPADRLRQVNRRIDDLARYVDSGRGKNPKSLSYKKLQGQPVPGSTHEFRAWSDRAAHRVFCHEEDDTIVLDELGEHL
jgi:putative CRISPR-associated protein (TIGR02619 family)